MLAELFENGSGFFRAVRVKYAQKQRFRGELLVRRAIDETFAHAAEQAVFTGATCGVDESREHRLAVVIMLEQPLAENQRRLLVFRDGIQFHAAPQLREDARLLAVPCAAGPRLAVYVPVCQGGEGAEVQDRPEFGVPEAFLQLRVSAVGVELPRLDDFRYGRGYRLAGYLRFHSTYLPYRSAESRETLRTFQVLLPESEGTGAAGGISRRRRRRPDRRARRPRRRSRS